MRELARLFTKLGIVGFGGPAAHIPLMREEVVRRLRWVNDEEFLDLVGAVNLLPGPNSTELAIHIGRRQAGTLGLIVAGVCFIVPSMLLVMGCAWAYVRYGRLPAVAVACLGQPGAAPGGSKFRLACGGRSDRRAAHSVIGRPKTRDPTPKDRRLTQCSSRSS